MLPDALIAHAVNMTGLTSGRVKPNFFWVGNMKNFTYYMDKAKLCEAAEFMFRGGEPDLARFYRRAKIGFLRKAQKALKKGNHC